jgi:hypothetical protein
MGIRISPSIKSHIISHSGGSEQDLSSKPVQAEFLRPYLGEKKQQQKNHRKGLVEWLKP